MTRDLPVNAQDYYERGKAAERQRLAAKLYAEAMQYNAAQAEGLRFAAHLIESEDQT